MADLWQVAKSSKVCAASGEEIPPEVPFYSGLLEGENGFERRDYSAAAWPEVDHGVFFSYWRNKGYSLNPDRRPPVDYERLLAFFDQLEGSEEAGKRLLRYVLALVLVRRRRLRLDDMKREEDGDRLVLFDRRNGGKTVEVLAPQVTEEELLQTQERLQQLFDADLGE